MEKGWHPAEDGERLEVAPLATSAGGVLKQLASRTKQMDRVLDRDEHTLEVSSSYGPDITILRPTRGMRGVNYENTLWYQIVGELDEERQSLIQEVSDLEKKIGSLQKKIDRLQEEEEEEEKRQTQSETPQVECRYCGTRYATSTWKQNNGECSECRQTNRRFAGGGDL